MAEIKFSRVWAMPNSATFTIKPIKEMVERNIAGKEIILDPFARGWKCVGQAGGLRWTGKRRPEVDLCPAQMKIRWEMEENA